MNSQMRRVAFSSFLGSVLEYYDFLLYATAAAVVFGPVFFAGLDPVVGTLASLGTLATGYLSRPLGGIVFGHFGDRIGRKRMLIVTMTIMGLASVAIGLIPTPAQIGALAPVLLVLLRLIQGFAIGGEWGGAVLMSAEHATPTRRGLWATFTTVGGPSGALLSTVVLAGAAALTTDEQFLAWGWRIPFLFSAVLLLVGLFVRAKVTESPVFEAAAEQDDLESSPPPLLDVLRNRPVQLLLSIGVGFGAFVLQSAYTAFALSFAVASGQPRPVALNVLSLGSVCAIIGLLTFAALSDRVGRRPVVLAGAIGSGLFAFAVFPMIASGSVAVFAIGLSVGVLLQTVMGGPISALYTELFSTRSRYTGASLGFQLASTGAGFAPLGLAAIFAGTGSPLVLSIVLATGCLISVVCILAVPETREVDLTEVEPIPTASAGGGST